ncbi:MAG: hypothetical protein LBQ27_06830, partial [Clostridiales bacterium]|nr:hypothetical protein [Clostridiales bacterium]
MDKLKKTRLKRSLVCLLLVLSLIFTLASCNDKDDSGSKSEDTSASTNLITNGNFTEISGSNAPFSPNGGWNSSSPSGQSDDALNAIKSGIIDTEPSVYPKDRNNSQYGWNKDIPNPQTKDGSPDSKVLMIYNGNGGAYYYYASFSASSGKFYKITIDLRAQTGTKPYIRLRGSAWDSFGDISAIAGFEPDKWQTFTFYVQAHQSTSKAVQIELWNGQPDISSTGAVFYDNVKAEEVEKKDFPDKDSSENTWNERYVSLRYPNPDFNASTATYSESSKSPVSPNDYSASAGTSKDTTKTAATGGSKVSQGIVSGDYTYVTGKDENGTDVYSSAVIVDKNSQPGGATDNFVLMIWNKDYTAYGYKSTSSSSLLLERGLFYKISAYVKTDLLYSVEYKPSVPSGSGTSNFGNGDYYKNANGSYSRVSTSSELKVGNFTLGIRLSLPVQSGSTTTRWLDVVEQNGDLTFNDDESAAIKSIVYTLYSLMDSNINFSYKNIHAWLSASGDFDLSDTTKYPDPETVDENTAEGKDAAFTDEVEAALIQLLTKQDTDGSEDYGDKWELSYKQFKAYLRAYQNFVKDKENTTLYYSINGTNYSQTSYKYGLERYTATETEITKSNNPMNLGGTIKLNAGATTIEIKGIITDGAWEEYVIYVQANQFDNTSFSLGFYLGEGGAAETETHVKGFMFVDTMRISFDKQKSEIDGFPDYIGSDFEDQYYGEREKTLNGTYYYNTPGQKIVAASIVSNTEDNLVENWEFNDANGGETGWDFKQPDEIDPDNGESYNHVSDVTHGAVDKGEEFLPYVIGDNYSGNILAISANDYGIFRYTPSSTLAATAPSPNGLGAFRILPYSYYRMSLWVKTENIPSNSSATVSVTLVNYKLNEKDEGKYDGTDGKTYDRVELSSVTGIVTTEDTENNGWTEVVFYIAGNHLYNDSQYVDFEIVFGSGTYMTVETLAKGDVYIAYPNMFKISYKDYTGAPSSAKKYEFTTETYPSSNSFTNGEFDLIDIENSKINDYGILQEPGIPSSWTFQDGKIKDTTTGATLTKNDVVSGIIDLNNLAIVELLAGYNLINLTGANTPEEKIAKAYEEIYGSNNELTRSNSLLLMSDIRTSTDSNGDKETHPGEYLNYGYKSSSSKSLSSERYYRVSVFA